MAYFRCGISNIQKFKGTAVDVTDLPSPIASFRSNASGVKLDSLKVLVEAVQSGSGTPSPDNVRPITGWSGANVTRTGKNVWDEEWELGTISATDGQNAPSTTQIRSKNYIRVEPQKTYFCYCGRISGMSGASIPFYCYDKLKNYIGRPTPTSVNNATFTTPANCCYVRFRTGSEYGTTYLNDISVNSDSTDTAYHAYNGNTYTILFGDTYYGCELDVTNGVLRVIQKLVDMGTANWEGSYYQFTIPTPSEAKGFNGDNLCSIYPRSAVNNTTPNVQTDKSYIVRSDKIYVKDTDYNGNLAGFKTAMAGQKLVFELATPFTIQLSPQQIEQLEENNIWADTGDVSECKYIQISQIGG